MAANTRTFFTDLAESGSLSSVAGNSTSNSMHHQTNISQQFAPTTSPPNHLLKTLANHSHNQHNHHHQQNQHQQQMSHQHHQQQQQLSSNNNHMNNNINNSNNNVNTNSSNSASSLHSHCNQTLYHNHAYSPSINNNGTSISSSSSSLQSTRLSQPMRTQIPIHCYIEQLDACADVPGYGPPLNDTDLFNTSNCANSNGTHKLAQKQQEQQDTQLGHLSTNHHHNNQPHVHQSKLALESVTKCNGLPCISSNSNNIFNENENTDNDNNDLDSNIDHISSSSPITINHSTTAQHQTAIANTIQPIGTSRNSLGRQSSCPNHHFQACRETYAIVTSNVLYIDLLRTVLLQLGYSAMDLINAKGKLHELFYFRL